jgi:hypothetical protein
VSKVIAAKEHSKNEYTKAKMEASHEGRVDIPAS